MTRRRFLGLAATLTAAAVGHGVFIGPRRIEATHTEITLTGLPEEFDGLRIVHLSDFHRGRWVSESQIEKSGEMARALSPDLVVLTGDMVTGSASYVRSCLEALGPIPSAHGTFAVLGNHDWWAGAVVIRRALRKAGIVVLSNSAIRLGAKNRHIWLLGVEDMWSPVYSLAGALSAVDDLAPRILLCHNPDVLPAAARWNIDLVLSGHTHGGQVCIPGFGPLLLPIQQGKWLASGLQRRGRTQIYVNRGVGLVAPPVRFLCPPEVALITMRRAPRLQVI